MLYTLEKEDGKDVYQIKSSNNQCYPAGNNEGVAQYLLKRLNLAHRPNIEVKHDGLYVCWNEHEKQESCDFIREIAFT